MLGLCLTSSVYAQDVIVLKDGSSVLSKVLEVNASEVKYKKWANQDGPTYTSNKAEILSINYQNGEKDNFSATAIDKKTLAEGFLKKVCLDDKYEPYNSFYFQYNPMTWDWGNSDIGFNGFSLGQIYAIPFNTGQPFYLLADWGLTYKKSKKDEMSIWGIEMEYHFLSANISLNAAWRMTIPSTNLHITPYAGVTFRAYPIGRFVTKYEGEKESVKVFFNENEFGAEAIPLALGWQVGVNLGFNNCYLGVSYGSDFTEMIEGSKFKTTSITLGLIY